MSNGGIILNFKDQMKKYLTPFFVTWFLIIMICIPYLIMDHYVMSLSEGLVIKNLDSSVPGAFTNFWILVFASLCILFKNRLGHVIYWIVNILWIFIFIVQSVYYPLTKIYFGFSLLQMASEGSSYAFDVIKNAPVSVWLLTLFFIVYYILLYIFILKKLENRSLLYYSGSWTDRIWFILILAIVAFTGRKSAIRDIGELNNELEWNNFSNPRNVYESFADSNKSMRISGLFEYTLRDFYMTFIKGDGKLSEDNETFLKDSFSEMKAEKNDYTGRYKGKNVIFLQLEGIDKWLLTKETMPNLYSLYEKSISFEEHYSMYTGGGSTFNSEFAVNTGFTTPFSYNCNVYTLSGNSFPYTMPRLFRKQGYRINAFHMNSKEFYSRGVNYRAWGYDSYNGLLDQSDMEEYQAELDRELILNEEFYNKMFKGKEPFVHYLITYTPHTPFTAEKKLGKVVAENYYGEGNVPDDLDEEAVVKLMAKETDDMIGLLIQALKDNDLYEDTIIVAYADHYLYTINDRSILDKYKITSDNRINNTPFFIWSSDIKEQTKIKSVTMQFDILPTVLNICGIAYEPQYYLGSDALASDREGVAIYYDYNYYNGKNYASIDLSDGDNTPAEEKAAYMIKKNDLTLKYDYFRHLK